MNKLKFVASVLIVLVIINCNSTKKYNKAIVKKHSVAELHKDIDYTFKKIEKLHPNLYWFITKEQLEHKIDSVKNSITGPMTSKEFFFVLSPLVSEIRQGHNSVNFPFKHLEKEERRKYSNSETDFSKIQFGSVEGKVIITEVYDSNKMLLNAELLQIGKFEVEDLVEKYNHLRSSDGYNITFYERRIGLFLKSYYRYENPRMDTVTLKLSINDSIFDTTFYREFKPILSKKERKAKAREEAAKKQIQQDSSTNNTPKTPEELLAEKKKKKKERLDNINRGYNKKTGTYTRDWKFLEEDTTIAYLKIRGFMNGPYEKLYDEFFAEVDTANSSTVVLDLRDNLGGRLKEIHYLMSYLAVDDFITIQPMESNTKIPITKALWSSNNKQPLLLLIKTIATPFLFTFEQIRGKRRDGIVYIKNGQSRMTEPKPNAFKGKVYVLVNANSFSAASVVPCVLKGMEVAEIVGEETGGTSNGTVAGIFKPIVLPNTKLGVQFGMGMIRTPYVDTPDGYGVIPDHEITPTIEDRKKGIDTELNWIIQTVKAARKSKGTEVEEELEEEEMEMKKDTENSEVEKKEE